MPVPTYFGAIEAGGTKINCAFGLNHEAVLERARIKTENPETSLQQVEAFFDQCIAKYGAMEALGIACFGPVDLDVNSPTYGYVIQTPKPEWSFTSVVPRFEAKYGIPVGFDLDVNGAAIGEHRFGAGRDISNLCYVTIGTGIGVGVIAGGRSLNGLLHPEFGHIPLHKIEGEPDGICESHKNCAAGLASGPAIEKRWGAPAHTFALDHPVWKSQAHYVASLCNAITLAYSPQRIILGGGVMEQKHLLDGIRKEFQDVLAGFVPALERSNGVESYIMTPQLGTLSGIAGAFVLAGDAQKRVVGIHQQHALTTQ